MCILVSILKDHYFFFTRGVRTTLTDTEQARSYAHDSLAVRQISKSKMVYSKKNLQSMKARFNRKVAAIRQRIRIQGIEQSRKQVINAGKFNVVQNWAKKKNPTAYMGLDLIRGSRKKAR